VRSDEPGAAGDQYPFHRFPPKFSSISVSSRLREVPDKEVSGVEIIPFVFRRS
jgi:hypothetical protein